MVDFVCYGPGDARTLDLYDFARGAAVFYDQTATSFKVAYGNGNVTVFQGYGFGYDPATGAPIAGTTTYGLRSVNGEPFGLVTGISITMEQAAAYIAMNDPSAVNQDVFAGDDRITGSIFDDYIDGWGGADWLYGGAGNDTYIIDNVGDRIVEAAGSGTDSVRSSVSLTLAANVETLLLTGSANINATGNSAANTLTGNGGANTLDGKAGADTLIGGAGNDTYIVDNAGDRVSEAAGGGRDAVATTVTYTLAAGQEIEELRIAAAAGDRAIDLTGNSYAQTLIGNGGANVLNGAFGSDVLTGKGGADSFVFANALGATNVDRVTDFASEDTLQLSRSIFKALAPGELSVDAFKNISTGTIDASDRILYKQTTGELFYDADGTGGTAMVKFAVLDNKAALTAADVFVV